MNNILLYAVAIVTALIVSTAGYGLHRLSVDGIEEKHRNELLKQAGVLHASCALAQSVTYGVSNEYQKDLTALSGQLDALGVDGLHNHGACVAVTGLAASGYDAAPTGKKSAAGNERGAAPGTADSADLISIAAKGEKYRLQLKACQSYVRQSVALQLGRMPQKGQK